MTTRPIDRIYERRLTQRNEALERYLSVLTQESEAIERHDARVLDNALLAERDLLAELEALEGVIRTLGGSGARTAGSSSREVLERRGTELLDRVKNRHAAVRRALKGEIEETGRRLESVAIPRRGRSVFRSGRDGGVMVDIDA